MDGGYRRLSGESDHFSLQTDKQTLHHNIYIIKIINLNNQHHRRCHHRLQYHQNQLVGDYRSHHYVNSTLFSELVIVLFRLFNVNQGLTKNIES